MLRCGTTCVEVKSGYGLTTDDELKMLRAIADGELGAEEAVRAYHGELAQLGITPERSLQDDLMLTQLG